MESNHSGDSPAPDFTRFFIELAISAKHEIVVSPLKLQQLHHVLHALAIRECVRESLNDYQTDLSYAGYLKRTFEDTDVFVPFNLARHFPSPPLLGALIISSKQIALLNSNPICISGSATFLKLPISVSDLDFCEYYILPINDVCESVARLWTSNLADFLPLAFRCASVTYKDPWPVCNSQLETSLSLALRQSETPHLRIDGVYDSTTLGLLPISNVILPLDPKDVENGSVSKKSFAYQEAVLVNAGPPPRSLVNANSLGKYLNFLKEEAQTFLRSNPLKSLKRLLSFFLLIQLHEPAETVIRFLKSDAASLLIMAKRQQDLDELRELYPCFRKHPISSVSSGPVLPPDNIVYARAQVQPLMEALAQDMLLRIDVLFQGASQE